MNTLSSLTVSDYSVKIAGWILIFLSSVFLAWSIPASNETENVFKENSGFLSASSTSSTTFTTGAAIISMGETPQTYDNALEPYALIYDLVQDNCPVYWAIDQSKALYGNDFTVESTDFNGTNIGDKSYKGGAFIITKEHLDASATAQTILNTWDGEGVEIFYTAEELTTFIHGIITSFPKVLINNESQNELINEFFANSKVPSGVYDVGPPEDLGLDCYDMFAAPHADPHSNWDPSDDSQKLLDFVNAKGYVWAGCHAVSALETFTNTTGTGNGNCTAELNFLSNGGLVPWADQNNCSYTAHTNKNSAQDNTGNSFTYDGDGASLANSPIFQYILDHDDVYRGGSEMIYMPFNDATANGGSGGWRSTTQIFIEDSHHYTDYPADAALSEGKAAICAVGPAFGDSNKGTVLYQSSHTLDGGTEEENAQGQRIFGNFMLASGLEIGVQISSYTIPSTLNVGQANNLSVTASGGTAPYTYAWTASCAGSFSDPTAASTTFTPSAENANCIITCVVTDACGRSNFVSELSNAVCVATQVIIQVSQN